MNMATPSTSAVFCVLHLNHYSNLVVFEVSVFGVINVKGNRGN